VRDQRGFNLETLGRNRRREREPGSPRSPQERSGFPLSVIGLLDLRDGVVRYVDRRVEPARELALEHVDISGSEVRLDRPTALVATASLAGPAPAKLELTGSFGPVGDPPGLDPIPLDLRLAIPKVDAASLPDGAAALDLSLPAGLAVDGPLSVEARAQGTLDQLSVQGTVDATRAAVRWGPDFAKLGDLPLEADVDGVRDAGETVIRRAKLRLGGLVVDAIGTIRPGGAVDVKVDSNHAELAELSAVLPAATGAEVGGGVEAHL